MGSVNRVITGGGGEVQGGHGRADRRVPTIRGTLYGPDGGVVVRLELPRPAPEVVTHAGVVYRFVHRLPSGAAYEPDTVVA